MDYEELKQPRIMMATIPLRNPSSHIPIASLAILSALKRHGFMDLHLYEINITRPPYDKVLAKFLELRPDIIGLSAVVSTSYAFVSRLSRDLKRLLPNSVVVCGGNLVASANIVLRRTGVDICCTGEGEDTLVELARYWQRGQLAAEGRLLTENLSGVKGIAYIGEGGRLVVTPYADQLTEDRIFDVDWDIAQQVEGIDRCFSSNVDDHSLFTTDPRYYEPKRRGKTYGRFYASKGCVARCTFCHRFTKGIRYVPIDILERRLTEFIERYNVGFICFSDENFATHQKWIDPFLEMIAKFDVLWAVGGIRVNKINADLLNRMHAAGCTTVAYGTETGSATMLSIMEKKVDLEDNYLIASITPKANLFYVPQLVIGMPGETDATIDETIDFLEVVYTQDPFIHPMALQVNYAQALPGTPLYEASRLSRVNPESIDMEEKYLMQISDKNARDIDATINHTALPYLIWKSWGYKIRVSANQSYIKKFGLEEFQLWCEIAVREGYSVVRGNDGKNYCCDVKGALRLIGPDGDVMSVLRSMDKNLRDEFAKEPFVSTNKLLKYPAMAYHLRNFFPLYFALKEIRSVGLRRTFLMLWEALSYKFKRLPHGASASSETAVSLRAATKEKTSCSEEKPMIPLRLGR